MKAKKAASTPLSSAVWRKCTPCGVFWRSSETACWSCESEEGVVSVRAYPVLTSQYSWSVEEL